MNPAAPRNTIQELLGLEPGRGGGGAEKGAWPGRRKDESYNPVIWKGKKKGKGKGEGLEREDQEEERRREPGKGNGEGEKGQAPLALL